MFTVLPSVTCPYCGRPAELVNGDSIYGPGRFTDRLFWLCRDCAAWVGCHKNSRRAAPMGRLADAELRRWKANALAVFDPLWRTGPLNRADAYRKLAKALGTCPESRFCHIGWMDVEQCKAVVRICQEWRQKNDQSRNSAIH